jgi:hypothetical protein
MTDEQYRALRQLILDQSVKIEALTLAVRRLQQSVETTEIIGMSSEDIGNPIDMPEDLKKFFLD